MDDPFRILNINYEYEIKDLDNKYYLAFKNSKFEEQVKINQAYTLLKNSLQRLKCLCFHYNETDFFNYLNIIFKIKKMKNEKQIVIHKSLKKDLGKYIQSHNWKKINIIIQFFEYLKLDIKDDYI